MDRLTDEKYMRRCLELARGGLCGASPNPMVGAVIVCDGRIIGEGYHIHCGGPHAEVNAVRSVRDKSLLSRSTVYVSLEPCAHYGRTPPCADMLCRLGVKRVVAGCIDPFARVRGRGIQKLRDAGIDVTVGVLEEECRELNRRFMTCQSLHRPYVTLKWAESSDGYIGLRGERAVISTPLTSLNSHRLRAHNDAILVGGATALNDDPSLTTRLWPGPSPLRIVIDNRASLPATLRLFSDGGPTLAVTPRPYADERKGVETMVTDFSGDILTPLLSALYERGIQKLLVEGGAETHRRFIAAGLWDEVWREVGSAPLGGGVVAPRMPAGTVWTERRMLGGLFLTARNKRPAD